MNGFGHLPSKSDQNTYLFYANASGSTSGSFQAWSIPEHAAFLHFTVIGGGGGGGSGHFSTSAGGTTGGGGGGAPAGLVSVSIPAILLPKTLYFQVGYGGAGGAPVGTLYGNTAPTVGNPGGSGTISYVCLYPEINAGSVLIQSSNTAPGGGAGGIVGAAAATVAGTAITIADTTNLKWLGIVGNTVAQTAGGNGGGGTSQITYAGLLTGGCGGGQYPNVVSANRVGGQIVFSITAVVNNSVDGGATAQGTDGVAGNGSPGLLRWKPFIATGGAGGGAGTGLNSTGGNGGKGAYGCGGGGGGAGLGNGGAGAPGGDGLIIISVS
jgi:hypothetical protein